MTSIVLHYTDGTPSVHEASRLTREEVDQFLDDISQGLGAVLVVDNGPLALPPNVDLRRVEVLGVDGDAWYEEDESDVE